MHFRGGGKEKEKKRKKKRRKEEKKKRRRKKRRKELVAAYPQTRDAMTFTSEWEQREITRFRVVPFAHYRRRTDRTDRR